MGMFESFLPFAKQIHHTDTIEKRADKKGLSISRFNDSLFPLRKLCLVEIQSSNSVHFLF